MTVEQKIDLSKMDAQQLIGLVMGRKDLLYRVLLVAGSLLLAVMMLFKFMQDKAKLDQQIKLLRVKLKSVDEWQGLEQKNQKFIASFPTPMDAEAIMARVSDMASRHQFKDFSFSSKPAQKGPLYETVSVEFSCAIGSFKDLVLFLRDLEQDAHPVRVQVLKIKDKGKGVQMQVQSVSLKVKP